VVIFPDGKTNINLLPNDQAGGPSALVPISADPVRWTGTPLGQYDAVIAVDPRSGTKLATYEIRIPRGKARE
jgi:hypothetical protein